MVLGFLLIERHGSKQRLTFCRKADFTALLLKSELQNKAKPFVENRIP